jgi:signal transduction histidine kinase
MLYDAGLLFTVAVTGWMVLDPLLAPGPRAGTRPLGALGLCGGLWAAGELLVQHSADPESRMFARRVLYLGACFIGVAWLWLGLQASRALERPGAGGWLVLAAAPPVLFYSGLYWDDPARWFSDWSHWPARRGPLFLGNLAWNWLLLGIGTLHFARAARRLRRVGSGAPLALVLAVAIPLAGNAMYLLDAFGPTDPTPILLGVATLLFRVGVVDSGLAACLPLGHSDVLAQLEAGVVVADLDGRVVDANPAAHRLVAEGRLVGRRLDEVEALAGEESRRVLEVRRFPLRGLAGTVGCAALLHDRTEAEQAALRLQLAARLEAVGLLTAGIAHEVNNPLAFIRANLVQLEKLAARVGEVAGGATDAEALGREAGVLVEETQEGVERIVGLVERLRRFTRHETSPEVRRPVQLADVARRAIDLARAGLPPRVIRLEVAPAPPVSGAEGELVQVVLNLLVNAIQASLGLPEIEVEIRPEGAGVALRVADRGPGIPDQALPHVFEPFFTTKPPGEGTGLGLSLSYDLVRRHGGSLAAANRPGGGAVFSLWLPAVEIEGAA